MGNKYYTPSIEEFYVGFECEDLTGHKVKITPSTLALLSSNEVNWNNIVVNKLGYSLKLNKEGLRVKYLDKEDIESLGFKQLDKDQYSYISKKSLGISPSDDNWIKIEVDEDHEATISREYGKGNPDILFDGCIKNINELKKVLTMIEVNYV